MSKKIKFAMIFILIITIGIIALLIIPKDNVELKTIKSDKQLSKLYDNDSDTIDDNIFTRLITMPFSLLFNNYGRYYNYKGGVIDYSDDIMLATNEADRVGSTTKASAQKDYSTTNIQVENIDEADITKTDGDYIYSLSDNNVVITNVKNPEEIKIEATITPSDGSIPEDLMLYKNQLVIICENNTTSRYNNKDTVVKIYSINDKANPKLVKSYELYEDYYTSRCIDNKLYVIASGYLRKDKDKIERKYVENNNEYEIELSRIKYLKDVDTKKQTLISLVDLDNLDKQVEVNSYLIDISNAYVSENAIYLLDQKYDYNSDIPEIKNIFGLKGLLGIFDGINDYSSSGYKTEIYKFDISKDGSVSYRAKTKIEGRTINQYSLDELNGHLRVALYDSDGARVAIFDEGLKQIGISSNIAKGETMYSSRFMGNKVYLVTYKNMDPLFVIDLSNESNPKVLGELHIPGYSTYLHPYDEEHLIGIGMETEEVVNRDSQGKVIFTTAKIVGMKMALFDVSDVNNPKQISQTVIGDRRTTSAILTNPKALLFSKQKQLIAIPINNYNEDFEVTGTSDTYESTISSYKNFNKSYVAEGYAVYKINLKDGFKLKGIITHENPKTSTSKYSVYTTNSRLLRGIYIDNNLYTISQVQIKVHDLETMEQVSELKIK